jgi:hypothetical protein
MLKKNIRDGGQSAYTNPTDHLAYNIKIFEEDLADAAADADAEAAADAAAAMVLQRERSNSSGSPFRASAGVSSGSDLATSGRKFQNSLESKRPATSPGHLTTSLDVIQPTISAGNLYPSLDGNEQAEPGNSGSRVLFAAAEVFLPNDADFVNKLASSARQHNRSFDTPAMKAHTDPQKARLTKLFWPPDVHVDADPVLPEAT